MRRALLLIGLVALSAPAAEGVAQGQTEETTSGQVTATLSYDRTSAELFTNMHVTVTRAGQRLYDQPVAVKGCGAFCGPEQGGPPRKSIFLRDLEADGETEVLVDLFTGGAHCCRVTQILSYSPATNSYSALTEEWGNGGYRLEDLIGNTSLLFITRDDGFAFAFGSYAASGYPIRILQYTDGKLLTVTTGYPREIRANAKNWLGQYRALRKRKLDVRGALGAYVADQYLLHRPNTGWRLVRKALRDGALRKHAGEIEPFGVKYKKALRRLLLKSGYGHGLP